MDSREDWRWCKWYEANCIRRLVTDKRISLNILLGHSASAWMNDWTLYGILHLHKLVTGQSVLLDGYKESWEDFLRTDPDCVRVKRMCDVYVKI